MVAPYDWQARDSERRGSDLWNRESLYSGNTFCSVIQLELRVASSDCRDMIYILRYLMYRDRPMKYKTASFQISEP
jgi:hypothetical protein